MSTETKQSTVEAGKVYRISSVLPTVRHWGHVFKNVPVHFFVEHREGGQPPVPYESAIPAYDPTKYRDAQYATPEDMVYGLFTPREAAAFLTYLRDVHHDDSPIVDEAPMPLYKDGQYDHPWDVGPLAVASSDPYDYWLICEGPSYNLPFRVWGFYDVSGCECTETVKTEQN